MGPKGMQGTERGHVGGASGTGGGGKGIGGEEGEKEREMQSVVAVCAISLRDILLGAFCGDNTAVTERWFAACEEAMNALYFLHPSPDLILTSIITPLFGSIAGGILPQNGSGTGSELGVDLGSGSGGQKTCSSARLGRLLFVLGQGALCTVVYAEKVADMAKKVSDKKPSKMDKDVEEEGEGEKEVRICV